MEKKQEQLKAVKRCSLRVVAYLITYFMRNVLSVTTPFMVAQGYSQQFLGGLSSAYFFVYAVGQLINGRIGDYVSPKYMVLTGLSLSGVAVILFSLVELPAVQFICYMIMGFGLSMLWGPMVRTITENTTPQYARIGCPCCKPLRRS